MKYSSKKVAKVVGTVLLAPIALIVAVPLGIILLSLCVWATAINIIQEQRFKRRLKRLGRAFTKRDNEINLSSGGSLIVESPTLGWNITRAWWTPDNVLEIAPLRPATDEERREATRQGRAHEWDVWCWENYTSLHTGTAFLLRVWNGAVVENSARRRFPALAIVAAWTGPVQSGFRRASASNSPHSEPISPNSIDIPS